MFDSLDTMLIMDLQEEFDRALPFVKQANFSHAEVNHQDDTGSFLSHLTWSGPTCSIL